MLNGFWPEEIAYRPAIARSLSFLSTIIVFALVAWQAYKENAYAAGAVALVLLAGNVASLDLVLQARGYGLVMMAAVLQTVALYRYLENGSRAWLFTVAFAGFVGTAALPLFVLLAAPTMVGILVLRRRMEVLVTAFVAGLAGLVFFYPTLSQIIEAAKDYADTWGRSYAGFSAILRTLDYFLPGDPLKGAAAALFVLVIVVGRLLSKALAA